MNVRIFKINTHKIEKFIIKKALAKLEGNQIEKAKRDGTRKN